MMVQNRRNLLRRFGARTRPTCYGSMGGPSRSRDARDNLNQLLMKRSAEADNIDGRRSNLYGATAASRRFVYGDHVDSVSGERECRVRSQAASGNDVVHDNAGNQTYHPLAGTFSYDSENRLTQSSAYGSVATYAYDAEGRRVKKTTAAGARLYVYDAFGQVAAEYSTQPSPGSGDRYLFHDHLGSVRLALDAAGNCLERWDYSAFGNAIPGTAAYLRGDIPCYGTGASGNSLLFTGQARDESGLDYFGARYLAAVQGRFTSPDPLLASGRPGDPQSWNRYTYVRNNPLALVDPTGLDWVASTQHANEPYAWVDQCAQGQTCHKSVAAVVNGYVTVFGSSGALDVMIYGQNEHGLVNTADIAGHPDANFTSVQTPGREENYLEPAQAKALFNVASQYHADYASDGKLAFTAGTTADGTSRDARGNLMHAGSHRGMVDLGYMGTGGTYLTGNGAAAAGDVGRNQSIINGLAGQNAGLGHVITGDPGRYGTAQVFEPTRLQHRNHMHFQGAAPRGPAPPRQR